MHKKSIRNRNSTRARPVHDVYRVLSRPLYFCTSDAPRSAIWPLIAAAPCAVCSTVRCRFPPAATIFFVLSFAATFDTPALYASSVALLACLVMSPDPSAAPKSAIWSLIFPALSSAFCRLPVAAAASRCVLSYWR